MTVWQAIAGVLLLDLGWRVMRRLNRTIIHMRRERP